MVTFLAGGTGTPKLLDGAAELLPSDEITVIANTGDDVELGGLLICPDVDTVLFWGGDMLDRDTWWGIAEDTTKTHHELTKLREAADMDETPRYLSPEQQTAGRSIARWRRFAGVPEFMQIGDQDRAIHLFRTSLIDEGYQLSTAIDRLATALDIQIDLLPMSDDPVASLIHTPDGLMHFQEFWVAHNGDPPVDNVEFRGAEQARPAPGVTDALTDPVVIGPSNPVTSIGPMMSIAGIESQLEKTPVVAVSPFIGTEVFSGPAAKLMKAVGLPPSTAGLPTAYPFADAFVIDQNDPTELSAPTVRTDITIDSQADAVRVMEAVQQALNRI